MRVRKDPIERTSEPFDRVEEDYIDDSRARKIKHMVSKPSGKPSKTMVNTLGELWKKRLQGED